MFAVGAGLILRGLNSGVCCWSDPEASCLLFAVGPILRVLPSVFVVGLILWGLASRVCCSLLW